MEKLYYGLIGAILAMLLVLAMLPEAALGQERTFQVRARVLVVRDLTEHWEFVGTKDVLELVDAAQQLVEYRLADLGVSLKTLRYLVVPDAAPEHNTIEGWRYGHARRAWERSQRVWRRRSITMVYAPPLEGIYFAGWASTICSVRGLALTHFNPFAEHALLKTALVATHEMGHLVGGRHDNSCPATIMHSNVGRFLASEMYPQWSAQTRAEVEECIRRQRRWRRAQRRRNRRA